MNVILPKELEEFVSKKASSGEYPDANAVVVEALREFQSKAQDEDEAAWTRPLPNGNCPPELRALLLEAVQGPHHPMPGDYFAKLRERLRSRGGQ